MIHCLDGKIIEETQDTLVGYEFEITGPLKEIHLGKGYPIRLGGIKNG